MELRSRAANQHVALHPNPGASIRLPSRERVLWVLGVWLPCLAYAIVRYNVLSDVAWTHLPLYVVNKSAALAGIVLVALAYLVGKLFGGAHGSERVRSKAKFLGLAGFSMITVHVLMAMVLLNPAYFEKFYAASGKFNLTGEMTFLFGVLAYGCLLFPAIATLPFMYDALGMGRWLRSQHMGYVALGLACGHTFSMGYRGWVDVAGWPGWMPPITLLGFLCALLALAVKLGATGGRRSRSVALGSESRAPESS